MTVANDYVPGACNIGSAEIRRRALMGWVGLAVFVPGLAVISLSDAPAGWALLLFIPAFGASAGFVQAAFRFCLYFGFAALFNFDAVGRQARVADADARLRDRRRARMVLTIYMMTAAAAAMIALAIAIATG